jgi:hypothetical protein
MDIRNELQKFNLADAVIADMAKKYLALTIKDLDDKEGFELVHVARMDVKAKRVEVTKKGKDLRAEANAYNKAVLDEEKRIIGLLAPIETHLETEENRITDEKEGQGGNSFSDRHDLRRNELQLPRNLGFS